MSKPKYRYKQYLTRALWNSILAVLSALVAVLVVVFLWQEIKTAITDISNGTPEQEKETGDSIEAIDKLRAEQPLPDDEAISILESLRGDETLSNQEIINNIDSLKSE